MIRIALVVALLVCVHASDVFAQTPARRPGKWEVGVHAGPVVVVNPPDGTVQDEIAGEEFTTVSGGRSLFVPTWSYGFGNALWRQVNTQLASPSQGFIAPLDAILVTNSARPKTGFGIGGRVTRIVGPRVRIEGSIDLAGGSTRVSDEALTALEATRASYVTAWQTLFASAPARFQNATVTSQATVNQGSATQLLSIGAVSLDLPAMSAYTMYVTVGGGVLSSFGDAPSLSLVSRYAARLDGTTPIDETDNVQVRYQLDRHLVVTMFGVGVRKNMSPRWGWRADIREHLSGNRVRNVIDATPTAATPDASGIAVFSPGTLVSLQLANPANTAARSTLRDLGVRDFEVFHGTGLESRFAATIGVFLRF